MEFEQLRQQYFHHVSCGPDERKVNCVQYSDILHHLPILEWYASKCNYIVEFGTRDCFSTVALLSGLPVGGTLLSVDIDRSNMVSLMQKMEVGKNWTFEQRSSLDPNLEIGEPDLIFFDTLHTYTQLNQELKLHMEKARKYLVFHDTTTCWDRDRTGADPQEEGIGRAIIENVEASMLPSYRLEFVTKWSNGLRIYERMPLWNGGFLSL